MQCSAFLAHLKFCRGKKFSFAFIGLWIAEILIAQAGYLHLEGFKWEKIADCLAAIKWYLEWSQLIKLLNGVLSALCLPWKQCGETEGQHDGRHCVGQHEAEY